MTDVVQVPTSGFQAPPAMAPSTPEPQGFQVPPAGKPITGANQQPGWVPQTPPTINQTQQPVAPAQQQPATSSELTNAIAMIQAALGNPPTQPADTKQVGDVTRPNWMGESANAFDVSKVEDPVLRSMAAVLQTAGKDLDLDRVIGKALASGDVNLIDTAYLRDAGGEQAANLTALATSIVEAVSAKAEAITQSVYASVGGENQWLASVAAFNNSAPSELRMTVAQMMNSTHEKFIQAGAKIVAEFGKNSGALPQLGAPLLNSGAAVPTGQGLSKVEFQKELQKIAPDTPGYNEARESLFARRSLGKQSGL